MSIQDRIKKVRLESEQTQEQFSASIGMKRDNYAKLEAGSQKPTFEVISAIVRIYHKSYEWLIEGKEKTNLTPSDSDDRGKVKGKVKGKVNVEEPGEKYIKHLTPVLRDNKDSKPVHTEEILHRRCLLLGELVRTLEAENASLRKDIKELKAEIAKKAQATDITKDSN